MKKEKDLLNQNGIAYGIMKNISGTYEILVVGSKDYKDKKIGCNFMQALTADMIFLDKGNGNIAVLKDRTGMFSRK